MGTTGLVPIVAIVVATALAGGSVSAHTQPGPTRGSGSKGSQGFVLTDPNNLVITGGKAEIVEYQGRKALRLITQQQSQEVFAFLRGVHIQDGIIQADIAMKTTTPPGVRMPGFVGIAFRASADASQYDLFYLRPGNSHSEDQAMRNHSVQYVAAPGYDWYALRRNWPWLYESWADLLPEHWSTVKVEIHGRTAKLFVNAAENPSLIVNGLKGELLQGGIALWGYAGEEAYFSNVRVTPAEPQPVTNGSDASGSWSVEFATDYGKYAGTMELHREGDVLKGTWSGDFGKDQPVSGTWRNGYAELTFNGTWPDKQAPVTATLAGWFDGDTAKGRMKVEGRADGQWTASRKK
jgi:hypothetical protein